MPWALTSVNHQGLTYPLYKAIAYETVFNS